MAGSSHWESFVTLAIAVIQWTSSWVIMTDDIKMHVEHDCQNSNTIPPVWGQREKYGPTCLVGSKNVDAWLVFIYMHQIHSSIFALSVDDWVDYVCIRRSLACLQRAIWGRLYHVCTRSRPRFDVLAMKLPSFQLKTFTVLYWSEFTNASYHEESGSLIYTNSKLQAVPIN